jgi:hypothetical protein
MDRELGRPLKHPFRQKIAVKPMAAINVKDPLKKTITDERAFITLADYKSRAGRHPGITLAMTDAVYQGD